MALNFGATPIGNLMIGNAQVDQVYLGSDLVWPDLPGICPLQDAAWSSKGKSDIAWVQSKGRDFKSCNSLKAAWVWATGFSTFPLIDTSAVNDFTQAWNNCTNLTAFPLIDTGAATSLATAWGRCAALAAFPSINTSNVTNFRGTWSDCASLVAFPVLDTGKGTSMTTAWQNCSKLATFPLLDFSSCTSFSGTWKGCSGLDQTGIDNIVKALADAKRKNPALTQQAMIGLPGQAAAGQPMAPSNTADMQVLVGGGYTFVYG